MKAANGDKNVAKMHDENQRGMLSRRNERCKPAWNAEEWTYEKFAKKDNFLKKSTRACACPCFICYAVKASIIFYALLGGSRFSRLPGERSAASTRGFTLSAAAIYADFSSLIYASIWGRKLGKSFFTISYTIGIWME